MAELAIAEHVVWREIYPLIQPVEFRNPYQMSVEVLRRLHRARLYTRELTTQFEGHGRGVPFRFVSDHRTQASNTAAGGAETSAHMEVPGTAVDLRVLSARERYIVVAALMREGFHRLGIEEPTEWQRDQFGSDSGTVHVDGSVKRPPAVMFTSWQRSK